jgi:succinate dehydrogenase/fumarate reductase flavoprotein subunit
MNGGIAVDIWQESSLSGCFAIGEVAGTHGVTRPGGAALNAGQVGGVRVAEQIASRKQGVPLTALSSAVQTAIASTITIATDALSNHSALSISQVRQEIQDRMSNHAGFLCVVDEVPQALAQAQELRRAVFQHGLCCPRASQLVDIYRWRHLALASEAVLTALAHYVHSGGGSRGARAYLAADGIHEPQTRKGPLSAYRFRAERESDRNYKLVLQWTGDGFSIQQQMLRGMEDPGRIFFEKNWSNFLTGTLYQKDFHHG